MKSITIQQSLDIPSLTGLDSIVGPFTFAELTQKLTVSQLDVLKSLPYGAQSETGSRDIFKYFYNRLSKEGLLTLNVYFFIYLGDKAIPTAYAIYMPSGTKLGLVAEGNIYISPAVLGSSALAYSVYNNLFMSIYKMLPERYDLITTPDSQFLKWAESWRSFVEKGHGINYIVNCPKYKDLQDQKNLVAPVRTPEFNGGSGLYKSDIEDTEIQLLPTSTSSIAVASLPETNPEFFKLLISHTDGDVYSSRNKAGARIGTYTTETNVQLPLLYKQIGEGVYSLTVKVGNRQTDLGDDEHQNMIDLVKHACKLSGFIFSNLASFAKHMLQGDRVVSAVIESGTGNLIIKVATPEDVE